MEEVKILHQTTVPKLVVVNNRFCLLALNQGKPTAIPLVVDLKSLETPSVVDLLTSKFYRSKDIERFVLELEFPPKMKVGFLMSTNDDRYISQGHCRVAEEDCSSFIPESPMERMHSELRRSVESPCQLRNRYCDEIHS